MSSDSENEFYDAVEATPEKEDLIQRHSSHGDYAQNKTTQYGDHYKQSATKKLSCSKMDPTCLSNKLASSMPSLYFEDFSTGAKVDAQSLLQNLDEKFSKDNKTTDMPPPSIPTLLRAESSVNRDDQKNTLETVSACSGSLLGYLGNEEAKEPQTKSSGRRVRHRDRQGVSLVDEDETVPQRMSSPCESLSSSMDGVFPHKERSAPFRVVEHDASSVYSTMYPSQEKMTERMAPEIKENKPVEDSPTTEESVSSSNTLEPITISSQEEDVVQMSCEPDIVASTKANSLPRSDPIEETIIISKEETAMATAPSSSKGAKITVNESSLSNLILPTAPPRRKKARKKNQEDEASVCSMNVLSRQARMASQRDFDGVSHILDIKSAMQGESIVNSQDHEGKRGAGPSEATSEDLLSDQSPKSLKTSESGQSQDSTPKSKTPESPQSPDSMSDKEILSLINITNLDTGESMPLSEAESRLPSVLNPLSFHIMKLTNSFNGDEPVEDSDEESVMGESLNKFHEPDRTSVRVNAKRLKNFLGKRVGSAVNKAKTLAHEVSHKGREEKDVFEDVAPAQNTRQFVKIKTAHSHKGPLEFDNLMYAQELKGEHAGPVWCVKHSPCGRLLATAGQDHVLRVWVLKQAFNYFLDIRTKWNADVKTSPTPSQESLVSQVSSQSSEDIGILDPNDDGLAPYMPKPFCIYTGHTADVLDLSWSKHYFILTSSMDKTARLWHISRKECLCIFKHVDFVTAIAFHPRDDRYFISGSLDGKLRLWSIPDKQVVLWNEVAGQPKLITAANFCQNGSYIVVGTYNGRCIFYKTAELKYYTEIHVKSSRGKNARGRKITGIEPFPDEDKLMVTSNDSRIRIYDLNVLNVSCKYKGHSNVSSQIRAGFSHDGKYIVSGSENQCIYLWKTHHDYSKFSSARKDRNVYWEGVKAHSAVVTCAVFSPHPEHVFNFIEKQGNQNSKEQAANESSESNKGYVLVSADFDGVVKVFLKKEKPKHSSLPASALV